MAQLRRIQLENTTSAANVSTDHHGDNHLALLTVNSLPAILLGICLFGAIVRTVLRPLKRKLPYTFFFALLGMAVGTLGIYYPQVKNFTVEFTNPKIILLLFVPVLIFNPAFEIESHLFGKALGQVLLLGVAGFLASTCLAAVLAVNFYTYNWDWFVGLMFGAIVSTTDPLLSVALLRKLGNAKPLILLIMGESLLSDCMSSITFEVFRDYAADECHVGGAQLSIKMALKIIGSPLFGFIMSKITMFWLSNILTDRQTEIHISLVMSYLTFYIAEWLGMSGVFAVLVMGLLLDMAAFSPKMETFIVCFWEELTYLANILIFFIIGLLITLAFPRITLQDFFNLLILYFVLNTIRIVTAISLSPLLSRTGYGFSWQWALVCAWGGTKGAFCLSLTLMAYQAKQLDYLLVREKVLVLSLGMTLLTLLINAPTMMRFLKLLGLCEVSLPRRMAMCSAVQCLRETSQNIISMLKKDRFLAEANWDMVESFLKIEDPYKTPDEKVSMEDLSAMARTATCPDCARSVPCEPSLQEQEDMLEEARMRILKAQRASYRRQHSSGLLTQKAARILINMADNLSDQRGKFMTIQDINKHWEAKGFLVALRRKLEDWLYNVKTSKLEPPRNPKLRWCHQVVLSVSFEHFIYVLIVLNMFPIILEFMPEMSDRHGEELAVLNYVFFTCYIAEALLKVLAMRKAYIFSHWNQFDLLIIVMAAADIIIDQVSGLEGINLQMIKIIRMFKMFRFTRALRLLKLFIPRMIEIINMRINKRLSFGYEIGKGYVLGQEDISRNLHHISEERSITKKLKILLENNRQQAMRELGLLRRDHAEMAISVKTKQTMQTALNSKRDTIHTLMSGGLLDDIEVSKLEKMVEIKMKKLTRVPPMIPALTAEQLLQNVPWLSKDNSQIQFFKRAAKLILFDLGDTIMYENEEPKGIHLIVFGMVKVTGRQSHLGVKETKEGSPVTDYLSCGAILGELNCLMLQPMEMTVICETAVQTCFVVIDSLQQAFDEFPSLENNIWHSVGMKITTDNLKENINYQGRAYHKICTKLSKAYLMDLHVNRTLDVYNDTMEVAVVIFGSCEDVLSHIVYNAPSLINKTSHQIVGTTTITKIFVVPCPLAEVTDSETDIRKQDSLPCLKHAVQRASRQSSVAHMAMPVEVQDVP